MEKSRASRKWHQVKFFTIVLILGSALGGCGPQHSKISGMLGGAGVDGQATFTDEMGQQAVYSPRPYTVTQDDEAKAIRDSIEDSEGNRNFAKQFGEVIISREGTGAEVRVENLATSSTLVFKGKLDKKDLNFIGNFSDSSGQRPELSLWISCSDQACRHADLFISDKDNHKTAKVVSTEYRILHKSIPDDETEDQVKSLGWNDFDQDKQVRWTVTENYPGLPSTYSASTIADKREDEKIIFHGPIENSDSGAVAADSAVIDTTKTPTSLIGIDTDNAVFQVATKTDPKKPEDSKAIIFDVRKVSPPPSGDGQTPAPPVVAPTFPTTPTTLPTTTTQPAKPPATIPTTKPTTVTPPVAPAKPAPITTVSIPPKCPVELAGEVNIMINDILKECGQKRVLTSINTWWKSDAKNNYKGFMAIYEASKTAQTPSQALDFKKMTNVLHDNGFPTVWSWVTQLESNFDWTRKPPPSLSAGELGVWQITSGTRATIHITSEEALEIESSTKAAVNLLYKPLIEKYPNNIPMVLAGYNTGGGFLKNRLTDLSAVRIYTKDFWTLCNQTLNPFLIKTTCPYVSKIISGMITSLDPSKFGMSNIGPMEAR